MLQPENAEGSIEIMEFGILIEDKVWQFWNAYFPIEITESDIYIECKIVQVWNA